jgi:hypothetical protein
VANPLRDLCPRARVVWRDGAARCSACGRMVNRATVGHPWRHVAEELEARLVDDIEAALTEELDRLLDPAEPTHLAKPDAALELLPDYTPDARRAFDLLRRGHNLPPASPLWPDRVAADFATYIGPAIKATTTDTEEN